MKSVMWVAATAVAAGVLGSVPAHAGTCTYSYNGDGFPQWAGACPSVMSPGRFGALRMGKTTLAAAKAHGLLAVNGLCGGRLDGVVAYDNWRRKDGVVVAWSGSQTVSGKRITTSKGLKSNDPLSRAKALYPGLKKTGYLAIPYSPGTGWNIYSVRARAGWLDYYVHNAKSRYNFFAVRDKSSTAPIKSWSLDGC